MKFIDKILAQYLRDSAYKIEHNQCELTSEEKEQLIHLLGRTPMSKTQAFQFLGISRSKFDYLLRCDRIPQGRKRFGFNELVWYKDELEEYKQKMQEDKDFFKIKKDDE